MRQLVVVWSLSHVHLFATPWTVSCQAPLSMVFSRQEYWSGLPFPSLGDLANPGIKPMSPALQVRSSLSEPPVRASSRQLHLPTSVEKKPACQCRRHRFDPWVRKIPWRRAWQHTPVYLLGESHGQRNLAGYSP